MPPPLILDPARLDFSHPIAGPAEIERINPHRHEFRLLDGVVLLDLERAVYAGYHDIHPDAFWVRGHIPGRPLFPGVLMIEAAAQLASFLFRHVFPNSGFIGFTGVDKAKFRGVVTPPSRLVIVGRGTQLKPRRMICESQGFVDHTMIFECEITGMPV
ncbi:MAG: beta-hydroxyacyl-ACP dehydratase [Phycisphaerae bacterium]|jgi:3-hydroxyacyl-[acyl-carrier-protein] dehydratase|nr:beta-hydroxyacyl-ACP dehydratase [Phycisphaerae bacterium]